MKNYTELEFLEFSGFLDSRFEYSNPLFKFLSENIKEKLD